MSKSGITGRVEIQAFGTYVEDYISEIMSLGIRIIDLRNENGIFYFSCARTKYKTVVKLAREYGIRTKLIERTGLYFKLKPYFKRYGAVFGISGYCLVIYILSQFIWDIRITGNENVTEKQILEVLNSSGISIGSYSREIDNEYAELSAMLALERLAWINIEKNGSRIEVKVSERTMNEESDIPVEEPCNVIALQKGVIVETEVYRGKLMIEKGSGVSKGDIIVSGTVDDGGGNILLQHADAKIIAECEDVSEFFMPFKTTEKKGNGNTTQKRYLIILGNAVPLFMGAEVPQNSRYKEETEKVKFLCFDTPLRLKTCYYEHLETVDITYTNGMALEKLDEQMEIYKENFFKDSEIVSAEAEYMPQDDGIKAVLTIIYRTNIAAKERIGIRG